MDDESNTRIQTVTYDDRDRVVTSSLAGGSNAVAIGYPTAMTRTVTDSLGTVSSYQLEALNGVARVKSLTGPGCTACGSDSGSSYAYTARQQLSSITDAIGVITTFSYDTSGNRLARTDASGTLLARTTTSTYTAKNELATITEASVSNPDQNRVASMAYDGKGNLLSRTVNGYSGTTTIAATTTFAYNSLGQITSVDGPRTAVKDTFTLAYYPNEEARAQSRPVEHRYQSLGPDHHLQRLHFNRQAGHDYRRQWPDQPLHLQSPRADAQPHHRQSDDQLYLRRPAVC